LENEADSQQQKEKRNCPIISAVLSPFSGACKRLTSQNIPDENKSDPDYQIAKWTKVVGNWTRGLVFVGVITVAVLFLQYCELRKTDDTTRASQRGFAYVKGTPWGQFKKGDQLFWRWLIEWENSGNTPIKLVNFALACPAMNIPGGPYIADPYTIKRRPNIQKNQTIISVILGPKQSSFGGQCEFPTEQVSKIQSGATTQYIVGEATYTDIFGQKHVTRYCNYVMNVTGDPSATSNIQVSSGPCIRHNCSDEECAKEDAEPNLPPEKLLA
jgi:hypothetical protein